MFKLARGLHCLYQTQTRGKMMQITRRAYINTSSEAGDPTRITFDSNDVKQAYVWSNSYGNPSYTLYLDNGDCLFLVSDYGAMNGIRHISARTVHRKKDLF